MSSDINDPLPNKSDNPSITVIKWSGDLDETRKGIGHYYWHGFQRIEY